MSSSERETAFPILRENRSFWLLFGAQIVSLTGSGVTTIGLALSAYQLTGGPSATAVIGNALTLRILAFLLFSQPAGIIADRVSRKIILIGADLIRFGLLTIFPFITAVWQIYVLIFAINAVTAFFTPTFEASIPEVVGGEQYVKALTFARCSRCRSCGCYISGRRSRISSLGFSGDVHYCRSRLPRRHSCWICAWPRKFQRTRSSKAISCSSLHYEYGFGFWLRRAFCSDELQRQHSRGTISFWSKHLATYIERTGVAPRSSRGRKWRRTRFQMRAFLEQTFRADEKAIA